MLKTSTQQPDKSEFDPCDSPDYVEHLGEVSQQDECIVSEDIKNDKGVLLVKKGTRCSPKVMAQLVEHRLSRPVDQSTHLNSCLNNKSIWNDIHRFISKEKDLFAVHETVQFSDPLRHLCLQKDFPRVLLQKLTVLKKRQPERYQHALTGAWLSALLAKQANKTPEFTSSVFTAGLFRDLGLLHIPKELLQPLHQLSDAQKRRKTTHALISQVLLEQSFPHDKEIGMAATEHHELPAGGGFPLGKILKNQSAGGQFLALAETLISKRNSLPTQPKSIGLLQSYVRMHAIMFPTAAFRAASQTLALTVFEPAPTELSQQFNKEALSQSVMSRALTVCALLEFLIFTDIKFKPSEKNIAGLKYSTFVQRVLTVYRASGYIDIESLIILNEAIESQEKSLLDLLEAEQTQLLFVDLCQRIFRAGEKLLRSKDPLVVQEAQPLKDMLSVLQENLLDATAVHQQ